MIKGRALPLPGGQTPAVPATVDPLSADDLLPALTLLQRAFGSVPHPDDVPVELGVVDPARFYAAREADGEIVATAGSFAFQTAVPGAVLPVAGVTWVGVHPARRRQGLLSALMDRQLADLHAEGTAVAALWASEGAIYGRFGYGPASWNLAATLPRGARLHVPVEPGAVSLVEPSAAALRGVYDRVAARTPGWPQRDDAWWRMRLHDPEHARSGAAPLQCAVTEGGYALYAVAARWEEALPAGTVRVQELVAEDDAARARLWHHVLDLDLTSTVEAWPLAADDPLLHWLLADPRSARARVRDGLWVRLVDVGAALAGRRYACEVDVVLAVEDARCPWNTGRWRLSGGRDSASCERTDAPADLELDAADLGAAYLGGTPLRARPVRERTPGALAAASTAFGPVGAGPGCPLVF